MEIAHHQQRRVEQRLPVAQKLQVGFLEIAAGAFVLPGEMTLEPHVSKAACGGVALLIGGGVGVEQFGGLEKLGVLDHAFLEAEGVVAGGIGGDGRGMRQYPAEIAEMVLVGGCLLAGEARPFADEVGDGHGVGGRLKGEG